MKALLFLALFSVLFVCDANPFSEAHAHLHGLFLDQKNYLDGIRVYVGAYSEIVAYDLMEIVASEIAGWQRRGTTCRENIFRQRNTVDFGEGLSVCTFGATTHLQTVQTLIHYAVDVAQEETYDIQRYLMRELQREDILEVSENFYDNAVEMGSQLMDRFYNVRYPELIATLEGMDWSVENLPGLLQSCIDAIPRKFAIFC